MRKKEEVPLADLFDALLRALTEMHATPDSKRPVVVVDDLATKRYVQFAGGEGREIFVDAPKAPEGGNRNLNERLAMLVIGPGEDLGDGLVSYHRKVKLPGEAAALGIQIFREVHALPRNARVTIESWNQEP